MSITHSLLLADHPDHKGYNPHDVGGDWFMPHSKVYVGQVVARGIYIVL